MNRRWDVLLMLGLVVLALVLVYMPRDAALSVIGRSGDAAEGAPEQAEATQPPVTINAVEEGNVTESGLRYGLSALEPDIVTMYLTVYRGNRAENTDHTWEEINTYSVYDYERMGVARYQAAALLQVGDENGPVEGQLGYGETAPNATVQVRGQTSSEYSQKNFKIELKKNKGEWLGQRTIALNKHQQDGMRFRNKLAYELLSEIPQLMGLRTQFVHLYVRDMTGEGEEGFTDYGLYTQVEQLNQAALTYHGLSRYGKLYKINMFEFYRYEDIVKETSDPTYDAAAMEALLENKTGSDNRELIRMLEAVNDTSVPVDTLLETTFDRENIQYWMAFQILLGNADTQNRNVYIYSPPNSDRWYFYSWDHDAALMRQEYRLRSYQENQEWECGISNYWGNVLFRRLLSNARFRAELDAVIRELYATVLSPEHVREKAERLRGMVEPLAFSAPDAQHMPLTREQYAWVAERLPDEITLSLAMYEESLEKPMPFYIGVPYVRQGRLVLTWDPAFDLDAETIRYTVEVSDGYDFTHILYSAEDVLMPEVLMDMLPAGQYFIRVYAVNQSGYRQSAFDYYVTDAGKVYGTRCFWVMPGGDIVEDAYEE